MLVVSLSRPWIAVQRAEGQVLVLAENLPEAPPGSARPGLRASAVVLPGPAKLQDGTATGWASAAQALSLGAWHDACPSLPGSSFSWHGVRSWCMLKE